MAKRENLEGEPTKDEVLRLIREYFQDARVGSAKFMALCDFVDYFGTLIDTYEQDKEKDKDWTRKIEIMMRKEVVGGRIEARTSEIPGYNAASRFIFTKSEEIPDMNDNEIHGYLFILSRSILNRQEQT